MQLGFERLVVLAFDLKLGLELLDLKFEPRDLGAEFREVGAHWALWRRRLLIRVRKASRVKRLSGLVRIRRKCRRGRVWLKPLRWRNFKHGRRREGVRQSARPGVFYRLGASVR